jgi:cholesterol oxidase
MQGYVKDAIGRMGSRQPRGEDNVPNFIGARFAGDPNFTADVEQPPMGYRFDRGGYRDNSFFGSSDGAKVTLDTLLLTPAMQRGLTVLDLHEAVDFGRDDRRGAWRVTLRNRRDNNYVRLSAPRLLLAAGTLNTLRLLTAAHARGALGEMPALGAGIGCNGDLIGYWACNDAGADYTQGTPCHGRFAIRGQEDDGLNLTEYGFNGIDGVPMPKRLRARIKRDLMLVGMGPDNADGTATWSRGQLLFRYSAEASPVTAEVQEAYSEIERRSGRKVYRLPRRFSMTAHVLGGARVDDDPARGVVNGHGEAHGLPGLFVLDASALPAASGGAPSMTIAGWAMHVANGIATHG